MDLGLKGKTVFVTGPAKGMGRAITLAFAQEGAALVLVGRDTGAMEAVAAEVRELGCEALCAACDVTVAGEVDAAVELTLRTLSRLDVLVNVAGGSGTIGRKGWEISPEEFDDIVALNLGGCFNTMRAVMPQMIAQGQGKIVNVGGTFGMRGRQGRAGYSASKWGLRGLTKSFALEAGPHGINVNCVAPGMVDGARFREKVCAGLARELGIGLEEAAALHAEEYALRRISTDVDVANACLFLASDVSRQITGVDLPVDGGWAAL